MTLMEEILSRENMLKALKQVESNKGAAGIDGITTIELRAYLREHWSEIKSRLLRGQYKPMPVRKVIIPKPDGRERHLGIPTVVDRLIQQAILQILTPIFDPSFSESSYGFRFGRSCHDAVRQAKTYILEGREIVVDIDLENFFDRVNHDILMNRIARKLADKRVLKLIRLYLQSGVMLNGVCIRSSEGTPQGSPLSPLLSNIFLDELDKELERRGHKFCRYADDCNIYVCSHRAGERVLGSVTNFLNKVLKLHVNTSKSGVDYVYNRKFLGFSFLRTSQAKIIISKESLKRVKAKIRKLTNPCWSISMQSRIKILNRYLSGWLGYYALVDTASLFRGLEGWLRRRLRLCLWLQWKRPRTRVRKLKVLGLSHSLASCLAYSKNGDWRSTLNISIHKALGIDYWHQKLGLLSLSQHYNFLRQGWRTAVYGSVCTVV